MQPRQLGSFTHHCFAGMQVELTDGVRVDISEKKLSGRYSGLSGVLSRLTTRAWERDDDIARRRSGADEVRAHVALLRHKLLPD